jgi:uncharacterized protein YndB with AHSA1/START domain
MTAIVTRIEIARPPEEVFAYVADPTRFPEWQSDVVSVRLHDDGRFTTVRRVGGADRAMTQEVTAREAPRRWSVRGVDGPIRPNVDLTVEPLADGAGSAVTFAFDYDGHAMGNALLPLVRRVTAQRAPLSVRRLKELLEG